MNNRREVAWIRARARQALSVTLAIMMLAFNVQAADGVQDSVTVQDLMIALVDPSADALWESVGTVVDSTGVDERRPRSEDDWQRLHAHAVRLVASADLLRLSDRPVAQQGSRSENPGIELDPAQTEWLMRDRPAVWQAMADALRVQSQVMLDAVKWRDADAIFDNGEALDKACEGCHRVFWYPDDVAGVPSTPTGR